METFDTVEVEVDESDYSKLKSFGAGCNTIKLKNDFASEIDVNTLVDFLSKTEGINRIQSLIIQSSSSLQDLEVIKCFPKLLYIHVYGNKIKTLNGLECFNNGQYIEIDTGSNFQRRISKISQAPIKRMTLQYSRAEDFDDIGNSLTINHLNLCGSPNPQFEKWRSVPLASISISRGKFRELGDIAEVESLKEMTIVGCRNFERFTGDNSRITWLSISGCNRLDLQTINTFKNIESLVINGNKSNINFSDFKNIEKIKNLSLINCKVNIDITKINSYMPKLAKLVVSEMKKEEAQKLSQLNLGVSISTKSDCFLNGTHI